MHFREQLFGLARGSLAAAFRPSIDNDIVLKKASKLSFGFSETKVVAQYPTKEF
jgi:hypothetical protein